MLDELNKQQKLIILGLVLLIFSGLGVMTFRRSYSTSDDILITEEVAPLEAAQSKVLVHISGAVAAEGVYRMKLGDRVVDAIKAAGGARPLANLSKLNLAQKVKDGEQIVVPMKARLLGGSVAGGNGKVNINTADEKGICKISGVGKTTARRILEHRKKNGRFKKLEDIMKVKGIGKGTFNKIKNEIGI